MFELALRESNLKFVQISRFELLKLTYLNNRKNLGVSLHQEFSKNVPYRTNESKLIFLSNDRFD